MSLSIFPFIPSLKYHKKARITMSGSAGRLNENPYSAKSYFIVKGISKVMKKITELGLTIERYTNARITGKRENQYISLIIKKLFSPINAIKMPNSHISFIFKDCLSAE